MIYQTKSTEFGEFCRSFFENLNFGQILSENLTEKHRNSRISPISIRTGKKQAEGNQHTTERGRSRKEGIGGVNLPAEEPTRSTRCGVN
jgi:hypothetical protein